jgi:hypothetical protein
LKGRTLNGWQLILKPWPKDRSFTKLIGVFGTSLVASIGTTLAVFITVLRLTYPQVLGRMIADFLQMYGTMDIYFNGQGQVGTGWMVLNNLAISIFVYLLLLDQVGICAMALR